MRDASRLRITADKRLRSALSKIAFWQLLLSAKRYTTFLWAIKEEIQMLKGGTKWQS